MWRRGDPYSPRGLVVAHRAAAGLVADGPVAGVRKAVELGVPMVEFDVRATADGVLVVQHDERIGDARLAEQTYGYLRRAGCAPPLLADVLEAAAGRIGLDVELKEAGYETAVTAAVLEHAPPEKVVFTSFDDQAVAALARQNLGTGVGLIIGQTAGLKTPLVVVRDAFPFARLAACGADFLVPSRALLTLGVARRAARRGIRMLVWDVNNPAEVARLRSAPGVLGVITDSPVALVASAESAGTVREA